MAEENRRRTSAERKAGRHVVRRYLSPQDIADELGVSRSRAYEIVRECRRLVFGRNVRVAIEDFEAWKRSREVQPDPRVTFTPTGLSFQPRPVGPRVLPPAMSPSRVPIVPRTKPRVAMGAAEDEPNRFRGRTIVPRTTPRKP